MTTGGSTSGDSTSPSSRILPGKRVRASSSAIPVAIGSAVATATAEIRRLSHSASSSASLRNPVAGSLIGRETVLPEDLQPRRARYITEEGSGVCAVLACNDCEGIGYRRVGTG